MTIQQQLTRAQWEPDRRSFMIRSGPRTYVASCDRLWISRLLVSTFNSAIPIGAETLDDNLARHGKGTDLPPRREVSISPGYAPATTIRVRLPDFVQASDVIGVSLQITVPGNTPCSNGFHGTYYLYQLSLQDDAGSPSPAVDQWE